MCCDTKYILKEHQWVLYLKDTQPHKAACHQHRQRCHVSYQLHQGMKPGLKSASPKIDLWATPSFIFKEMIISFLPTRKAQYVGYNLHFFLKNLRIKSSTQINEWRKLLNVACAKSNKQPLSGTEVFPQSSVRIHDILKQMIWPAHAFFHLSRFSARVILKAKYEH